MSSENVNASEESGPVTEADYNELFCEDVGGETEVRHRLQLWGTGEKLRGSGLRNVRYSMGRWAG